MAISARSRRLIPLAALAFLLLAPVLPGQEKRHGGKGGGGEHGEPPELQIDIRACEEGLWANMPGGMSALVETEGAATTPECAAMALGATKQALSDSAMLHAGVRSIAITLELVEKLVGPGLGREAIIKLLEAAIESGGTLDGLKEKVGEKAAEMGAGVAGEAAAGEEAEELEKWLAKEGADKLPKLLQALLGSETVETHEDRFRWGICDGHFVVTVTASFAQARGEVRLAADGDCHCAESRGGVRIGKFSVVGVAPLTFGNLQRKSKKVWTLTCTMGQPRYWVVAPCCQMREGHWTSPGPERTPGPEPTPTRDAKERKETADYENIQRRCDPDGRLRDLLRWEERRLREAIEEKRDEKAIKWRRSELARVRKELCDCLRAMRSDPSLQWDTGLMKTLDDMIALYCVEPEEPRTTAPPPAPSPTPAAPCASEQDFYRAAFSRYAEDPSPQNELSLFSARKALCECLRKHYGGKLPPDLEAFCDPKKMRTPKGPPVIAMTTLPARTADTLVGLVLPSDTRPGDTITGTVVTDPKTYEHNPTVTVLTTTIPLPVGEDGKPVLTGTTVTVGGGGSQPAEGSVVCDVPKTATNLPVSVTGPGGKPVNCGSLPVSPGPSSPPAASVAAPPACSSGGLVTLKGSFTGKGTGTSVAAGDQPAAVVAESPRTCVAKIPDGLPPGPVEITVTEGGKTTRLKTAIIRLRMSADRLSLLRGESTNYHVVVEGLDGVPESAWRSGPDPSFVDQAELLRLAPGHKVPKGGEGGHLLLAIENGSRGTISLKGSKNEVILLTIERKNVTPRGTYEFSGVIQSLRDGRFTVHGALFALLGPSLPLPAGTTTPR